MLLFNVDRKVKNSNVIVITEKSDHDRVASISFWKRLLPKSKASTVNVMKIYTGGMME